MNDNPHYEPNIDPPENDDRATDKGLEAMEAATDEWLKQQRVRIEVAALYHDWRRVCLDAYQGVCDGLPEYYPACAIEELHDEVFGLTSTIPHARELTTPLAKLDPTKWQG